MLREKLKAQINYYFPDETPDPDAVAQVLSDGGLRNLDFTLHGMSLVIHLSADAFYPEHHTLIETSAVLPRHPRVHDRKGTNRDGQSFLL